jgi:hypothetical protein
MAALDMIQDMIAVVQVMMAKLTKADVKEAKDKWVTAEVEQMEKIVG